MFEHVHNLTQAINPDCLDFEEIGSLVENVLLAVVFYVQVEAGSLFPIVIQDEGEGFANRFD